MGAVSFTDTDTEVVVTPQIAEPGDHEKFAHIVDKRIQDPDEALVFGLEVQALCGKRWVPTRDPQKFPVCPTCKEIMSEMEKVWKAMGR